MKSGFLIIILALIVIAAIALIVVTLRARKAKKSKTVESHVVEQTQSDLAAYHKVQEPKPHPVLPESRSSYSGSAAPMVSRPRQTPTSEPRKRSTSSGDYASGGYISDYTDYSSGSSGYSSEGYSSGSDSSGGGSSSSSSSDSGSSGGGCD